MMVMKHDLNVACHNLTIYLLISALDTDAQHRALRLLEAVADDDLSRLQSTLDNSRHIAVALTLMASHS
jgi:hypothetical protein